MYFKITNQEENHYGFQYYDGLNILDKLFNEEGSCVPGGLYFTDNNNICRFLGYGIHLREIHLPLNDPDFKMVLDPGYNKWRANKIILGKKYFLGDIQTFEYLKSIDADFNIANSFPIRWAAENGYLEVVKYLAKNGADIEMAFKRAVFDGHLKTIKILIEMGADPNCENDYSIRWAAHNGHLLVVKYLVSMGADIRSNDDCPVRWAAENGHFEIVKYLYSLGANVLSRDNYALRSAAERGYLKVVEFLVGHGADVHAENNYALRLATRNHYCDMIDYLVEQGAFISDNCRITSH